MTFESRKWSTDRRSEVNFVQEKKQGKVREMNVNESGKKVKWSMKFNALVRGRTPDALRLRPDHGAVRPGPQT